MRDISQNCNRGPAEVTNQSTAAITLARRYNRPPQEAERLGICLRSLCSLMADRKIPYYKVGKSVRLDPVEVDEALFRNFRVPALGEPRPPKRRAARIATPASGPESQP